MVLYCRAYSFAFIRISAGATAAAWLLWTTKSLETRATWSGNAPTVPLEEAVCCANPAMTSFSCVVCCHSAQNSSNDSGVVVTWLLELLAMAGPDAELSPPNSFGIPTIAPAIATTVRTMPSHSFRPSCTRCSLPRRDEPCSGDGEELESVMIPSRRCALAILYSAHALSSLIRDPMSCSGVLIRLPKSCVRNISCADATRSSISCVGVRLCGCSATADGAAFRGPCCSTTGSRARGAPSGLRLISSAVRLLFA